MGLKLFELFKSISNYCIMTDDKQYLSNSLKSVIYLYENGNNNARVSSLHLYVAGFEHIGKYNTIEELKLDNVEELIWNYIRTIKKDTI